VRFSQYSILTTASHLLATEDYPLRHILNAWGYTFAGNSLDKDAGDRNKLLQLTGYIK
jgi:hypothetical protein